MLASVTIPKTRFFWILMAILLPFIFFLHPLVVIIFLTIAIGNVYVGYKRPEIKPAAWATAIIFVLAAVLKLLLKIYSLSDYESSYLGKKGVNEYVLDTSIENQIFLLVSILVGIGILLPKYNFKGFRSRTISSANIYLSLMIISLLAGFLLIYQYSYEEFPLKTGLSMLASILVMLMMAFDSTKKITAIESFQRFKLVTVLAIIFSLVIVSKSFIWESSVQKLRQAMDSNASPCLELDADNFKWINSNPYRIINTWALPTLALIEQNITPRKLLLEKGSCKVYHEKSVIKFDEWSLIPKEYIRLALQEK
jgi:hypothetical protein